MITQQELNEMKVLSESATAGPWHIGRWKRGGDAWAPTITPDGPGAPICRFDRHGRPDKDVADSNFIAAAREFIPKAIAALPRWIPLTEQWPKSGENVLVFQPNAYRHPDEVSDGRIGMSFHCQRVWNRGSPTHWMPLPPAP